MSFLVYRSQQVGTFDQCALQLSFSEYFETSKGIQQVLGSCVLWQLEIRVVEAAESVTRRLDLPNRIKAACSGRLMARLMR